MSELIVLHKEIINDLKKLFVAFIVVLVIYQIAFYRENFVNVLRVVAACFWLFAIPGVSITFHFREKLDFLARFVLGCVLGLGIYAVISYYLGLAGLRVQYHWFIIPPAVVFVSLSLNWLKNNLTKHEQTD